MVKTTQTKRERETKPVKDTMTLFLLVYNHKTQQIYEIDTEKDRQTDNNAEKKERNRQTGTGNE